MLYVDQHGLLTIVPQLTLIGPHHGSIALLSSFISNHMCSALQLHVAVSYTIIFS